MSNYYETLMIVRPTAEEESVQAAIAAVRDHVTTGGGEVLLESTWGKRRLAYDVGGFAEGIYVQLNFTAQTAYPPTLQRVFHLHEDIIRTLTVRTDGPPPPPEEIPNYLNAGGDSHEGDKPAPRDAGEQMAAREG